MVGQHLLKRSDEACLVANAEERAADILVGADRLVNGGVSGAFRPVQAQFGRRLAGDVDRDLVARDGERPLVQEGQQVGRGRQV